ncbi:MAG: glutathione transferase GstA [Bacteriovoracaceae bacterium]
MKLFYSKGACSLAPHIILNELNMVFQTESVDLAAKTCVSGDYKLINEKGAVPALKMENGEVLTECVAILNYLADQKPEMNLLPKFGTNERYRAHEWLNFISTEVHKGFAPLWVADRVYTSAAATEVKNTTKTKLTEKFNYIAKKLENNDYLLGKNYSVADAYMFTCLSWAGHVGMNFKNWPNLEKYLERVGSRPAVVKTLKEEGLL